MCELSDASDATDAELRHGRRAIAELRQLEDVWSNGRTEKRKGGRADGPWRGSAGKRGTTPRERPLMNGLLLDLYGGMERVGILIHSMPSG